MAKQAQTKGLCSLRGAEYPRAGMSKHIIACAPEHFV